MVLTSKSIVPIIIGISLCSVSAVLVYILFKKEDDEASSSKDDVKSSQSFRKEKRIAKEHVPAVLGRGGYKVKEIEEKTGARVNFADGPDAEGERLCILRGSNEAIKLAETMIDDIVEEQKSLQEVEIKFPSHVTGRIIGRSGDTINRISLTSGAKIKVNSDHGSEGCATIKGTPAQITTAKNMIEQIVEEDKANREKDVKKREPRGKHSNNQPDKSEAEVKPKTINSPPAGSNGALLEVFVSAVSSPSRFWMQIVGPQVEALDKLVDSMTEFYSNADNRELHKLSEVQVGQMVAAVFRADGKWYRAKVVEIKPNEFDGTQEVCDVYFVDYGDNEYVAKNELLSLRTDMLTLRFQAVECFLSGVSPAPSTPNNNESSSKWSHHAVERFEDLTHVAQWKPLWSRTCTFKERPKSNKDADDKIARNTREGSPIPGVKLYDTKGGIDTDIAQVLIDECLAVEVNEQIDTSLSDNLPLIPKSPVPPSFGDLESSRVLDIAGNREERAASLPHGGSTPSQSPLPSLKHHGQESLHDDMKPKSQSLAAGMDHQTVKTPEATPVSLSYASDVNDVHLNGNTKHQNGNFIDAERGSVRKEPIKPIHVHDPKDDLKAKMNRVDSHHGSLEAMGKQGPTHPQGSHR